MYEQVKDQWAWQLEQGRELSALKEKVDAMQEKVDVMQETGIANRILDGQTAMGLAGLDGCIKLLEKQALGAEGVLSSRQIESFLRVFKQFAHTLPSRQVVG